MAKQKFAVFDIDGTVFRWQLYHELFDAFAHEQIIQPREAAQVFEARENWQQRQTSYFDYEMSMVAIMRKAIVGLEESRLNTIADSILEKKGLHTYRYTLGLMRQLKDKGYIIISISGSYQQLVDRFAKLHGIDIAVGREHTVIDGKMTAESKDIFGRKDEILHALAAAHNLTFEGSYAVGDSEGDLTMLNIVDNPIAFNPDSTLKHEAMENGWPIVIERKSLAYRLEKGTDGSYVLAETDNL